MQSFGAVLLEAIWDTAKILPLLFVTYYLVELLEYKYAVKLANNKFLQGKLSPIFGSLIGSIPQCGFSVVSTDLFSKKIISVGALIAVFIATSDEAIPLMIASPKSIPWMFALIIAKILFAIVVGYMSVWLYKVFFKQHQHKHEHSHEEITVHGGCCHHDVESKSFEWLHPLLHCLKIALFIFIVNVIFGCITELWIGQDKLTAFMSQTKWAQPALAIVVGLIPNCASSFALTELFLIGGLSFGALFAGLSVNAGLGLIFLLRQNKNKKENLFIILTIIISSLVVGYLLNFIH